MKITKKHILIGLGLLAAASASYFAYQIYFILDTFTPSEASADVPIDVVIDKTVQAGDEIGEDPASTQPQNWADTLTDLGNGQFSDSNNNIYTLDADGDYLDSNNNVIDDSTGEILVTN